METKLYLIVTEYGDILLHKGELIIDEDSGISEVIDITNPNAPMIYLESGWTEVDVASDN